MFIAAKCLKETMEDPICHYKCLFGFCSVSLAAADIQGFFPMSFRCLGVESCLHALWPPGTKQDDPECRSAMHRKARKLIGQCFPTVHLEYLCPAHFAFL